MIRISRTSAGAATVVAIAFSIVCPQPGWSWGGATHHYIAQNYSKHLPPQMDGLRAYDSVVDQKVTDPDTRKSSTPGEAPRHFIDIDAYPEFQAGTLTHSRAALEQEYGAGIVLDNGIVPWAVGDVVGTLTSQFRGHQWSAAATTIADLCHYVGDATQPLHCTRNFDGQYSGDTGVHARYETDMMEMHLATFHTDSMAVEYYANPVDAAFAIVASSWSDVDPLITTDLQALSDTQGTIDGYYYDQLWNGTYAFTKERVDAASRATASFVYTAWVNAGRPYVPGSSAGSPAPAASAAFQAGPSPFRDALLIQYAIAGPLQVDVFDVRGRRVERVVDGASAPGSITWRPSSEAGSGVYFVRLTGPGVSLVKRVTRIQ